MTRTIKTLIFFLLTLVIFSSCKKTNAPTNGQLVAARIRSLLGDPIGKQVYAFSTSTGQMLAAGPIAELGGDGQLILQAGSSETRMLNLEAVLYYTFNNTGNLTLYF
jgi:hypothetical protein